MLSEAFSFILWSTMPPIPLKAILDHLKCQMEAFYCNNQTPPIFSDKWGTNENIKIEIGMKIALIHFSITTVR